MLDPLLVFVVIMCIVAVVPVIISIRQAVYDADAAKMFDASENIVRYIDLDSALDLLPAIEAVDAEMQGFQLIKVASFAQYVGYNHVSWRYIDERLDFGVALGYRTADSEADRVDRQVTIIVESEDVARLWPDLLQVDAAKRHARILGYQSVLRRMLIGRSEYRSVIVCDPFITAGAEPYMET
jgi:hypothetical protein